MNNAEDLQACFCPFGYLDIKATCKIGDKIGIYNHEIFEIIDDFRESIGFNGFDGIDPVYCVLEHILQIARNKIEELAGYDFLNDFSGSGTEIYTYSNYLCSNYDYSEEAREELEKVATPYLTELMEDKWCHYFLSELHIGAK